MIVDARQFLDLASISILSHHCGGLSKRQSHRDVLNSQVKSQTVLDDDNIGSVFLQLKQLYGSGLCDGLGIFAFFVILWMEKRSITTLSMIAGLDMANSKLSLSQSI
ncbi:hypothetical protein BASA60_006408 [Batrachochytrium salamandrivorans]|nr:hypothetical protein BASA60_006408 [Batrachochytrium salamandrivorans]